jgi:hypothetical protein
MSEVDATTDIDDLRRLARWSAALAIVLSVPSTLLFAAAWAWNLEAMVFGDPATILGGAPGSAPLLRWGAYLDMFYSYLLLAPLALFLHRRLRPIRPWLADLGTLGAFAYIFVGAAGAAILGTVGPTLIESYAVAPPAERPAIAVSFAMLRDITFGVWQVLDPLTAGTWILSVGWLLLAERPLLGRFLLVLACGAFAFGLTSMFGIHSLGVLLATVLAVVLIWVAWVLAQRPR